MKVHKPKSMASMAWMIGVAAFATMLAIANVAAGQVVINMPAPKKTDAQPAPVNEGAVALNRYAQVRRGPQDTYNLYQAPAYPYYGYGHRYPWFGWPFFISTTHCHRPIKSSLNHCRNFSFGGLAVHARFR